ncbi:nucleotidyltransferase family protein [Sulfurimonas sp. SAG-AH-194-I05]|nr:nucleotidyltransferase family protein [Sulfurimonas sp. SAG-AH-194-I05]MDF1874441.1 nucleotidyltransferase family protein [Sulfurimonas sp. SAG-AH-194-I05]
MIDYKKVLLKHTSTVKEALEILDSSGIQIALVIDDEDNFLGTITDGDIRRGFLKNISLSDSIETIIFTTPTVCQLGDTKDEILAIALEKKIYQIPVVDSNGKLVGIEKVDELLQSNSKKNKVVLMVGGLGTRLRPLTNNIPKPMLKVGNKPILETIILNFKKYGFTNIILSVSYKAEIIEEYFGNGKAFGVDIQYIHENKRMGTAGALSLIREKLTESFFVMNGDLLTNINFESMMDYHISIKSHATMGVREYDFQVPYGVVNVENENIMSIEEKPVHKFFVNGGIYILNPCALDLIPDDTFYDMPTLFESIIKNKGKSISFPIKEYWLDIGRIEEFEKANNEYNDVF